MTEHNADTIPLLKRPLKPGQAPLVGLTPPVSTESVDRSGMALQEVSGGSQGAEPTRFGDWERKGRCSDF